MSRSNMIKRVINEFTEQEKQSFEEINVIVTKIFGRTLAPTQVSRDMHDESLIYARIFPMLNHYIPIEDVNKLITDIRSTGKYQLIDFKPLISHGPIAPNAVAIDFRIKYLGEDILSQ